MFFIKVYTKLVQQIFICLFFSQVDNDGDGTTDQRPINEGDPDGGVGAKPGWFGEFDDEDDSW